MTNPFYNPTGAPANQSRGVSALIRYEFSLISAGFDLVAPIANPTFTGIPAAPTAAPGTNTTQIATTAFVIANALSSALPGQAGNAGKYITTNGSVASWGDLIGVTPATSDNSTKVATTAYTVARIAQDAPSKTGSGASGTWSITASLATAIAGGAAGQITYQTGPGVTGFVPVGSGGQILTSGGTGSPAWISTVPVANGGTGDSTAAGARTNLGAAASGPLASSGITGAVPTGLATASGLTQNTGKVLGRTTASTGAIEEITPDSTLSLSAGALGVANSGITAAKLSGGQSGSAPIYGIRAFITFNATAVVAAAGNATVVRNGTGDFTISFTTALPAGYAWSGGVNRNTTPYIMTINSDPANPPTTTSFRALFYATAGGLVDPDRASFMFIG